MVCRKRAWSELPHELLSAISDFLTPDRVAVSTFRSVCSSWRCSCNRLTQDSLLSPHLPLPLPLHRPPFSQPQRRCSDLSFLSVTVIYALRRPSRCSKFSSNTWVLFLDEFTPGKLRVREPFSYWSYSPPINFPECIDLVDFNAVELGRFYSLCHSYDTDHRGIKLDKPGFNSENADKVVLSCDGLCVFALFGSGKLGMIRLGEDDGFSQWEVIHDGKGFRFDDIVEYKGRVLGIDRRGRVYEIGCGSTNMNPIVPPIAGGGGRQKRLVESLGLLYLVVRCNDDPDKSGEAKVNEINEEQKKAKFKVYELDEKRKKWVEMKSIGDRSFFIGVDFSFSASALQLDTNEKNCILFKKGSFQSYKRRCNEDMLFNNLKESVLYVGVCHLHDAAHCRAIELYTGYLDSLWPPPPWIWSIARSKRLGILETTLEELLNMIPEKFKTDDKEHATQAAGNFLSDLRRLTIQDIAREVLKLKQDTIKFQQIGKLLKVVDRRSEAGVPMHERREPRDMNKMMRDLLRLHHTSLFLLEERATKTEMFAKARLPPILADSSHRIAEN